MLSMCLTSILGKFLYLCVQFGCVALVLLLSEMQLLIKGLDLELYNIQSHSKRTY